MYAQMGISILDTRDLFPLIRWSPLSKRPEDVMRTYSYATIGSCMQQPLYKDFVFGTTEIITSRSAHDLKVRFEQAFSPKRKHVLIGHSFSTDLRVLQDLGIDVTDRKYNIIGMYDTYDVAKEVFCRGGKLGDLVAKVGVDPVGRHVAGNDANFTLRLMLLLVVRSYRGREEQLSEKLRERLRVVELVGGAPVPSKSLSLQAQECGDLKQKLETNPKWWGTEIGNESVEEEMPTELERGYLRGVFEAVRAELSALRKKVCSSGK